MKIKFETNERRHLFYMYTAACRPTNIDRETRRNLLRIAIKFNSSNKEIDLKPVEISLTESLLRVNIKAYEKFLMEPLIYEEELKIKYEEVHEILSTAADKLTNKGDENVKRNKGCDDSVSLSKSRKKQ